MYRQNYPDDPGMHVNTDNHTRVRYQRNPTFVERVGSSVVGVLVGSLLLCVGSGLIFWNEGRAVKKSKSLDEGLSTVYSPHTIEVLFEENNGKLVYVSGQLNTDKELTDSLYEVSVSAVKLKREVEMYQWVEHEHRREVEEGAHTREEITYSYSMEWRREAIRSSSFDNPVGHHNPDGFAVQSHQYIASDVKVGAFHLSAGLIEQIADYKDMEVSVKSKQDGVHLYMGYFYHGNNPIQPQVGDLRVKFSYAGPSNMDSAETVSIIGMQGKIHLEAYQTEAGHPLELLYHGKLTPREIFGREHAQNTLLSWGLRFGGWLLMFVGFSCVTRLIATLVDWLPIIAEMVAMGMHLMSLVLSISLSLTVIAMGWIFYRPLLGITILILAASPFMFSRLRMRSHGVSHRSV